MHTKSDNIEIMMGNETDETIEELFEYLLQGYQERLEESMKGNEFIFDSIDNIVLKKATANPKKMITMINVFNIL